MNRVELVKSAVEYSFKNPIVVTHPNAPKPSSDGKRLTLLMLPEGIAETAEPEDGPSDAMDFTDHEVNLMVLLQYTASESGLYSPALSKWGGRPAILRRVGYSMRQYDPTLPERTSKGLETKLNNIRGTFKTIVEQMMSSGSACMRDVTTGALTDAGMHMMPQYYDQIFSQHKDHRMKYRPWFKVAFDMAVWRDSAVQPHKSSSPTEAAVNLAKVNSKRLASKKRRLNKTPAEAAGAKLSPDVDVLKTVLAEFLPAHTAAPTRHTCEHLEALFEDVTPELFSSVMLKPGRLNASHMFLLEEEECITPLVLAQLATSRADMDEILTDCGLKRGSKITLRSVFTRLADPSNGLAEELSKTIKAANAVAPSALDGPLPDFESDN